MWCRLNRSEQGNGATPPRAYHFDGFTVELARHRVVGPADIPLPLSGRAYDLLTYLIEHRDKVVGKDELMKVLWPRAIVEENNLNQAISLLRRALGDQRDAPRYIATIAGRGYRFIADVTADFDVEPNAGSTAEPAQAPAAAALPAADTIESSSTTAANVSSMARPNRRLLLGSIAALGVAGIGSILWSRRSSTPATSRSIAVLPFQPLIEDGGNDALQLGIADALITRLSSLPGVVVAPLSSVRSYSGHGQDPLAAGRALGVASVLESHIQLQNDRVRLTARLLDVGTGSALWSGRFDEALGDFFAIQDSLAKQVVEALEVQLSVESLNRLNRRDTENVEAWQLYLQGRFQWGTRTEDGFRRAIESYEAALALDPNFARAAAGLADTWAVLGVFNMVPPADAFANALAAVKRAITLDNELAEAQAALGHILVQGSRDWHRGEEQYRRAMRMKPSYGQAVFWYANNLCYLGHLRDALAQAQLAQALEPMSVAFAANVGMIQYFARDFAAARQRLAALVRTVPQYSVARRHLARVLLIDGDARAALELLKGHEAEHAPGSFSDVGRALALDGQTDAARAELARIESLGAQGFGVGYDVAMIRTALGDREEALAALERGVADGSQTIGFLNSEPALDTIREERRFRAVSKSLGLG